jgi:hypothetical protein
MLGRDSSHTPHVRFAPDDPRLSKGERQVQLFPKSRRFCLIMADQVLSARRSGLPTERSTNRDESREVVIPLRSNTSIPGDIETLSSTTFVGDRSVVQQIIFERGSQKSGVKK